MSLPNWPLHGSSTAPHVTTGARMQGWTAKALESAPEYGLKAPRVFHAFTRKLSACSIGYIVMQFMDGKNCDSSHVDAVARVVQVLIGLRGPDSTLGHIGGSNRTLFLPRLGTHCRL
jgi:hypothetical protein